MCHRCIMTVRVWIQHVDGFWWKRYNKVWKCMNMTHVMKIIIMDELPQYKYVIKSINVILSVTASKPANDSENNTTPRQPCGGSESEPHQVILTHTGGAACSTRARVWAADSQKHDECWKQHSNSRTVHDPNTQSSSQWQRRCWKGEDSLMFKAERHAVIKCYLYTLQSQTLSRLTTAEIKSPLYCDAW